MVTIMIIMIIILFFFKQQNVQHSSVSKKLLFSNAKWIDEDEGTIWVGWRFCVLWNELDISLRTKSLHSSFREVEDGSQRHPTTEKTATPCLSLLSLFLFPYLPHDHTEVWRMKPWRMKRSNFTREMKKRWWGVSFFLPLYSNFTFFLPAFHAHTLSETKSLKVKRKEKKRKSCKHLLQWRRKVFPETVPPGRFTRGGGGSF